jgi:hypothetical protein
MPPPFLASHNRVITASCFVRKKSLGEILATDFIWGDSKDSVTRE